MTTITEQLASTLFIQTHEVEDFIQTLNIHFNQHVTAKEVLAFLESYKSPKKKGKINLDHVIQHLEHEYIHKYTSENIATTSQFLSKIQSYIIHNFSFTEIKKILPFLLEITPVSVINHGYFVMILTMFKEGYDVKLFTNFIKFIRNDSRLPLIKKLFQSKKLHELISSKLSKTNINYILNILEVLADTHIVYDFNEVVNFSSFIQKTKVKIQKNEIKNYFMISNKINVLGYYYKYNSINSISFNRIINILYNYIQYHTFFNDIDSYILLESSSPSMINEIIRHNIHNTMKLIDIYSIHKRNKFDKQKTINYIFISNFIYKNKDIIDNNQIDWNNILFLLKNIEGSIENAIYLIDNSLEKIYILKNPKLYENTILLTKNIHRDNVSKIIKTEKWAASKNINVSIIDIIDTFLSSQSTFNTSDIQANLARKSLNSNQKKVIVINTLYQQNTPNINLFLSRIHLYQSLSDFCRYSSIEIHTYLHNKNIHDESLKDAIHFLKRRNKPQTYIFEFIQLVLELKKIQSPFKNPDQLIDDILFKTGIRTNAQKLLTTIKSYDIRFHVLEYCYIYTYIKEGLPNIDDIPQFIQSINPMAFLDFQQRLSFIANPSIKTSDELALMFNSITNDVLPRSFMHHSFQPLKHDMLTDFMTSYWNTAIHHTAHIQTVIHSLWDDICSEKRMYEIPSNGRAEIEAPAILTKYTNILSFKFIQEGLESPSIYVLALFRSNNDTPLAGTIVVNRDGSIKGFVDLINNRTYYFLVYYMIIATYHAFVIPQHREQHHSAHQEHSSRMQHEGTTIQQRSLPRIRRQSGASPLNDWYEAQAKATHTVIGHERYISKTFRAAHIKYLQAEKAGITLRPGHTWVQGHARGEATSIHENIYLDGDDLLKPTLFKAPDHLHHDLVKYFNLR